MEILPASVLDFNALRKLEQACFGKDAWPWLDLFSVLTFPNVIRLKAVNDSQMIGFVAGDPRPSEGLGWIATIGVDPRYQRRGIGRALLHECEKQLNASRLRLTVRMSNHVAISLYQKEGYRTIDTWHRYYNDGEDGIVMEKVYNQSTYA